LSKRSKSPPDKSISAARISQMHGTLRQMLRAPLGLDILIEEESQSDIAQWSIRQQGSVEFFLRQPREIPQSYAKRDAGVDRTTPVVPLQIISTRRKPAPLKWWVGWRESWIARGARQFSFDAAGWSLFCSTSEDDHLLLLRAEWDHVDAAHPQNAGQPHWHIHRVLDMVSSAVSLILGEADPLAAASPLQGILELGTLLRRGIATPADDTEGLFEEVAEFVTHPTVEGLVEEKTSSVDQVGTTRMHLAMAGWIHPGEMPSCWQYPLGDDVTQVITAWSAACLHYLQSQLPYIDLLSVSS
jgi:hypothetical protein